jgi:hypothetical protein
LIWTGLLNCNQERRNCITWFRQERVPFASLGKSTEKRSWRRFVSWMVILWYSVIWDFKLLQLCVWDLCSSEIWHCVTGWLVPNFSR